jgi:solute carrier family 25 (mitochondrial carnitine/acylcarnitine transporter), member 20/29
MASNMMVIPHNAPRPSFLGIMRRIYATNGVRGFYAGLAPSALRAFPANACAFYVYEGLMRVFKAEKVRPTPLLYPA